MPLGHSCMYPGARCMYVRISAVQCSLATRRYAQCRHGSSSWVAHYRALAPERPIVGSLHSSRLQSINNVLKKTLFRHMSMIATQPGSPSARVRPVFMLRADASQLVVDSFSHNALRCNRSPLVGALVFMLVC